MEKILSFDPKKCKAILAGYYFHNGKYYLKLVANKHFMIREQGYGIQEDVIEILKVKECQKVIIQTPATKLKSKFETWLKVGVVKDYGHGKQRFLPVKEMEQVKCV